MDDTGKSIYWYIKENGSANLEIMCNELGMGIQDVNIYLTILELKGLIANKYGSNYVVKDELYV